MIKRQGKTKNTRHEIVMFKLANQASPFMYREAYRNLRTNLEFLCFEGQKQIIAVTSSISGEGKSCISVNLAYMLAQSGKKVILIDGDLRKPYIHKYLKILNDKGLSSVLYGLGSLDENINTHEEMGFDTLLAGSRVPNPAELLGSGRMKILLETLRSQYDYIVIDTSPVGVVTDAAVLSSIVDGVVYIVKQNYASRQQIKDAYKNLTNVNANVMGVILNHYNFENDNKFAKYEQYYNYYESESREEVALAKKTRAKQAK